MKTEGFAGKDECAPFWKNWPFFFFLRPIITMNWPILWCKVYVTYVIRNTNISKHWYKIYWTSYHRKQKRSKVNLLILNMNYISDSAFKRSHQWFNKLSLPDRFRTEWIELFVPWSRSVIFWLEPPGHDEVHQLGRLQCTWKSLSLPQETLALNRSHPSPSSSPSSSPSWPVSFTATGDTQALNREYLEGRTSQILLYFAASLDE